ncbi:3-hydroxyacyl-CoA dehydrogenase NAD-binding domain-containing protein [Mesorhizobium sp. M0902]|uniref:3-hydroxyacyl-CoA dehydrogenase NAD-binding domain-containing protein n=1 Tax=Mesorhizobium sp. M0902 TaxID=2957021 RepID=UPI0033353A93
MPDTLTISLPNLPNTIGLLAGGAIGGGWAARFVLNGVNVRLYDPAPNALDRVSQQVNNARRAYSRLLSVALPPEGSLTLVDSIGDAVKDVELVQESAPEDLKIKQKVLAEASKLASRETLICSSTSGLRPTALQSTVTYPERFLVGHPFNPVYMLPLVELCAGEETSPESMNRAAEIYQAVGMRPLVVRKEVDGFVANRLQEALWREALWLVHDEVATVEEVDDAIRFSFGLRRAINGPFRMAGGGDGMRRYMEQWGPMLQWPWSKLSEVPGLTKDFLDKLASQSDSREAVSSAELEQQRDDCYVAVLQGLRSQGYGAGALIEDWENTLRARSPQLTSGEVAVETLTLQMPSDWVDSNGHINESRYLEVFSKATGMLEDQLGAQGEYKVVHGSYYTVETHLSHLGELFPGDHITVLTQILDADKKRLRIFHTLTREGDCKPVATAEQMLIHVDATSRRACAAKGAVRERVFELARIHAGIPRPARAGASIQMR